MNQIHEKETLVLLAILGLKLEAKNLNSPLSTSTSKTFDDLRTLTVSSLGPAPRSDATDLVVVRIGTEETPDVRQLVPRVGHPVPLPPQSGARGEPDLPAGRCAVVEGHGRADAAGKAVGHGQGGDGRVTVGAAVHLTGGGALVAARAGLGPVAKKAAVCHDRCGSDRYENELVLGSIHPSSKRTIISSYAVNFCTC